MDSPLIPPQYLFVFRFLLPYAFVFEYIPTCSLLLANKQTILRICDFYIRNACELTSVCSAGISWRGVAFMWLYLLPDMRCCSLQWLRYPEVKWGKWSSNFVNRHLRTRSFADFCHLERKWLNFLGGSEVIPTKNQPWVKRFCRLKWGSAISEINLICAAWVHNNWLSFWNKNRTGGMRHSFHQGCIWHTSFILFCNSFSALAWS